jgi:hypothetical protein
MFNNFFTRNGAAFEIMRENMAEPDRPQMTVQHDALQTGFSYPINQAKNTDTLSQYLIVTALPLQQRFRERASKLTLSVH